MRALELVGSWPAPHVSGAVLRGGHVVATIGDQHHPYRLASIAKVVTAYTALIACEEGTLELDVAVGQPGCTLRHLLSHAGGYPFDGPDPIARPGTRRIYSNTGIELAADELSRRAEMPFDEYLRLAVVEPLGMSATELRGSPAHALWSTAADLARFAAELMRPALVDTPTAAQVHTVQFPGLGGVLPGVGTFADNSWGIGAEIRGTKQPHWTGTQNSPATFGHFGGAGTLLWVDPHADVALLALTDLPFDDWTDTALRVWPELSDAVLAEVAR